MDNNALKGYGPGFVNDLARMGGNVVSNMTQAQLKGSGPSSVADLARQGGGVVGPEISGTPTLVGTNGVAMTSWTAAGRGGNGTLTYSRTGTWPTGVSLNSSTGATSGTPSQTGTFTGLVVTVTDANGRAASLPAFTMVVS